MDRHKSGVTSKRYEIGRLLGQGTFAKVYYGRSLVNNQSVAIKVIDKEKVMRVNLVEQIKREISVLGLVRKHPNIVYLYEVMASKVKIYFVMEYAKGGELFDKVAKGKLKEDVAQKYFRQLICAVDFCHSRGVYHRDLKPENLLLDENEDLKVSDFGLSAVVECKRKDGLLHTTCGTPAYVAPEIIGRKGYDGAKADIWSCGVILFVLLAGYLPFHDSNLMEMYRKIVKSEYKCPSWFPKDVRRLMGKILDPNPDSRISIAKIKESSWYRKDLSAAAAGGGGGGGGPSVGANEEEEQEPFRPAELNAFDIISLSCEFDLSGFLSREPASVIISRLMETARKFKLKVKRKDRGLLNFEGVNQGRNGVVLIDAEIFEVTSSLYWVEMRKANGDTLEYNKLLKEDIRPALQDIVLAWHGEQQLSSENQNSISFYQQ